MERVISVNGVGHVKQAPDTIVVSITLVTIEADYEKTLDDAAIKVNQLSVAMEDAGFKKEELKTERFDVTTKYEQYYEGNNSYKQRFVGYEVTQDLRVTFGLDNQRLIALLNALTMSGSLPRFQIQFTTKEPEMLKAALLKAATKNAWKNAEILAEASGLKLGKLMQINYDWNELQLHSGMDYQFQAPTYVEGIRTKEFAIPEVNPLDIELKDSAQFIWAIK